MPTRAERTFGFIVDVLLYPARIHPRLLTQAGATVAIVILVGIIICVLPPIKDWIFCSWSLFRDVSKTNYDRIKNWMDFTSIACQGIIAITVGGFVFTDGVASWLRHRAEALQTRMQDITEALQQDGKPTPQVSAPLTPRQQALRECQQEIENLRVGVSPKNIAERVHKAFDLVDKMYKLLSPNSPTVDFILRHLIYIPFPFNLIPGFRDRRLIILMGLRYGVAFPGGFYGLLAYIFFLILIFSSTVKTYFDYPGVCS